MPPVPQLSIEYVNLSLKDPVIGDSARLPTDQRGVARPQGLACDIGAFELAPSLAITLDELGTPKLHYVFQAGKTNQIQASTNLTNWTALGTRVSDSSGSFDYLDSPLSWLPWRFYRVLLQGAALSAGGETMQGDSQGEPGIITTHPGTIDTSFAPGEGRITTRPGTINGAPIPDRPPQDAGIPVLEWNPWGLPSHP